jgi:inner membrane multidrug efflux protein bpeB
MLVGTILSVFLVPLFYVVIRKLFKGKQPQQPQQPALPMHGE